RAGVVMPAGAGGGVDVLGPGVPVAGAVSQRAERGAQALVAAPAKARGFAFAGLDRDGGLAGVAGERIHARRCAGVRHGGTHTGPTAVTNCLSRHPPRTRRRGWSRPPLPPAPPPPPS